ncbi:hypothetical protein GQ53DRAFT_753480 [Thozetella sp. PMI_491]|nr:hypothetical protein GQ53DRAFT_753480 [Thozetella sp. PMI_491]
MQIRFIQGHAHSITRSTPPPHDALDGSHKTKQPEAIVARDSASRPTAAVETTPNRVNRATGADLAGSDGLVPPVPRAELNEYQEESARKSWEKLDRLLPAEDQEGIWASDAEERGVHPLQGGETHDPQRTEVISESHERVLAQRPVHAVSTLSGYPRPSDQVYVLGSDLNGRYIAHALAGCKTIPPVRYLIYSEFLWKKWLDGGRAIRLQRGDDEVVTHDRIIAEFVSRGGQPRPPLSGRPSDEPIQNLILTLPCHQIAEALSYIRHRIDHRTTICLTQDGLGVAELLEDLFFPDPLTRPVMVLAHTTHALGFVPRDSFAVSEVRPGRLFLSAIRSAPLALGKRIEISYHPPIERTPRTTHMMRLLTAMHGLKATGHPLEDFYRHKLPVTAFRAVADPLTAIMNCTYDKIPANLYARNMFDRGIGEVCNVLMRLPEAKNSLKFASFVRDGRFRQEAFHKLKRKQGGTNALRWAVRWGQESDIDFLTGYFIKLGGELGVKTTTLENIMMLFKAAHTTRSDERKAEIPFEEKEYVVE